MALFENKDEGNNEGSLVTRNRELEGMLLRMMETLKGARRLAEYQLSGISPDKLAKEFKESSDSVMRDGARLLVPQLQKPAFRNRH